MIYRTEHPKPQFMRKNWTNLNGIWQFEQDPGVSGEARGLAKPDAVFSKEINVPFCPESTLSGIGCKDFIPSVWYQRKISVTEEQLQGRVLLHFGAVDHQAKVFVNGQKAGSHKGGYCSFSFDITPLLTAGENTLTVQAIDPAPRHIPSAGMQPVGKQSDRYESYGCLYTRTTGIWQTVWMEFVPKTYIIKTKYITDAENGILTITASLQGKGALTAEAFFEGKPMGRASLSSNGGTAILSLPLAETHLWEVGKGGLYDLTLTYGEDKVQSYFGLRTLELDGCKFRINGKSVFQRLVLDQGFFPDGIYTAPSDAELEADIDRALAMGFNGARLHEKVFEERYLYHCDRKGYLAWGEFPNWGVEPSRADAIHAVLPEWLEVLERDFNHPAIIGWCPLNETNIHQCDDVIRNVYLATKAADPTRPCIDTSGYFHVETDIYDVHDYEHDVEKLVSYYKGMPFDIQEPTQRSARRKGKQAYDGKLPFFVSEYGGISYRTEGKIWGYGTEIKNDEEFLALFRGITDVFLDNPYIFGFCYTQLTDVEQEQNGLYFYNRKPKIAPEKVRKIMERKAAIED